MTVTHHVVVRAPPAIVLDPRTQEMTMMDALWIAALGALVVLGAVAIRRLVRAA